MCTEDQPSWHVGVCTLPNISSQYGYEVVPIVEYDSFPALESTVYHDIDRPHTREELDRIVDGAYSGC